MWGARGGWRRWEPPPQGLGIDPAPQHQSMNPRAIRTVPRHPYRSTWPCSAQPSTPASLGVSILSRSPCAARRAPSCLSFHVPAPEAPSSPGPRVPARPTPRRAPRCPLPRLRTAKGPVESPVGSGAAESPGAGPQSGPSPPGPRLQRGRRHRDPPSGSATAAPGSPSGTPGTNQPSRNSPEIPFKK